MNSNIFDRLSFLSLFLVVVLLPLFFLPFTKIPIETSKGLLLVVGLALCVIFWSIARFLDGKMIFPRSWLLVSGFGIVLAFFLSTIFSKNPQVSWFGTMFDVGSFWFIFSGFILMLMSSIVFRTPNKAKIVLLGTILSSAFVLVFQSLHLFMPKMLSFGILADKTSNILGSWNALGIFAGFSCLIFLLMIEFFEISKVRKILLEVMILLSVLLAAAVNFSLVWILLGISSLIIFVYKVSITSQRNGDEKERKNFPLISFIVVMVSLLFFISGQFIGNIIPNRLQIVNSEVGPSVGATMSVTKGVLVKDPIFGTGPNRFGDAWAMYKPVSVNNSPFWDVKFNSGSGLLPTLVSTTGSLGILTWIVFLALFLIIGAKSVFFNIKNGTNLEMISFFVLSIYLFISSLFYSTGVVMFFLALAFAGVFVGLSAYGREKEISMSFLNDHRKSFFSILALIVVIIFSATMLFKYVESFASVFYFQKALTATAVPEALTSASKALKIHVNDLYLRTYTQIHLVKLNSILSKGETLSDADKADLQASFEQAVNGAQLATEYNPSNYNNFQLLGSVYQTAALLGVEGAYSKVVEAYKAASILNPNNPGLKFSIASALFADGKIKEAKDYANIALTLKPDYIDTLIVLSRIAKSEGDNAEALSYAQRALAISPANAELVKYVASLKSSTSISAPAPDTTKNR